MNVMDALPNMMCSPNVPPTKKSPSAVNNVMGGASSMMWSIIEANRMAGQGSQVGTKEISGSTGDNDSIDSSDDSILEDGPSVVEVSPHPPVFSSESITASESLLSSEMSGIGGPGGGQSYASYSQINDPNNPPADSSQILDDLSGMESERDKVAEQAHSQLRPLTNKQQQQQQSIVVKQQNLPPVKIYNTSMPVEMEKQCLLSMNTVQNLQKSRTTSVTAKSQHKKNKMAHKKYLKNHPNVPPIPDISIGESHEISTMSASEDSNMFHRSNRSKQRKQQMMMRNENRNNHHSHANSIPENARLPAEAAAIGANTMVLFDSSFQDETRSCMPTLLQRSKRKGDVATASSSSRSIGMRLFSRSGDANTATEKENNQEKEDEEPSPYLYEYESGANTYVAYFEASKSREIRSTLQMIEHPNPPLLPYGSNEVVVKIEVRYPIGSPDRKYA